MKENLSVRMRSAVYVFKKSVKNSNGSNNRAISRQVSDNYYILEQHARRSAEECRCIKKLLKGSDLLPSLFERCRELCEKGVLPDEEKTVAFFGDGGLSGLALGYLPLAITCALIDIAAETVKTGEKNAPEIISNVISSIRRLGETDFDYIAEKLCTFEKILVSDPSKIYSAMDNESKNHYRKEIAQKARAEHRTEKEFASFAAEKAKKNGEHIGKYIVTPRRGRKNGYLFLIMEVIMPLSASFAAAIFLEMPLLALAMFFPFWELFRYSIERASMKGVMPKRFLRIDRDDEKVLKSHTLITISTILPSPDKISKLERHLEQLYLSNCMGNIKICCLTDLKAADMPEKPADKIAVKAAREMTERLNKKYSGGFIFALRPRSYSKTQNEFIGKERKRGAITALIREIKGEKSSFSILCGDIENITKVKYLIVLDADTGLVFDSARELISIAEHPLNQPVISNGRVVDGYGILVPKTENRQESDKTGFFSLIMSGDRGITAYDSLESERYQDLFGEGIFSGKGLINVDAYYSLLNDGLPKERILSHDTVESAYLRAGFVPDVKITEGFPESAGSYYRRLHRWIRGDWQNIGFIFGKNSLNFVSKYKMFDNLRRSLVPLMCFILLAVSMIVQGYEGIFAAVIALAALSARNIYAALNALIYGGFAAVSRLYYSQAVPSALAAVARAYISVAYSARECFVCTDAALKALWRMFVSKKKLLEWMTAAQSESEESFLHTVLFCIPSVAASVLLFLFGMPVHRLLGLIILTDIPLTLFGNMKKDIKRKRITEAQRENLLSYASAMWGFFEEQCGRSNNFLPPDNVQISPVGAVAQRTSPTNIGLMLVSFLAARDFGFITTQELFMRLKLSFGTIEKLEKYEGNLLNWYDTVSLETLSPRFVSTVDSGNFLCCLVTLKEGLREYVAECPSLAEIIEKAEKTINETNLRPLYNNRRKLFHIGLNPDNGEKSGSYYDLYMSEARMTAYFAVARRIVPKSHWGALGRIAVGRGRYTGLASWTGTMFEYFMPNLFIPAPFGSLSHEALLFCLQSQRKRAGKRAFGISESGFYAFDGSLNYQYKAHGVQSLGLKNGLNREFVVSPYSSFLTLTTAPQISVKNLKRLSKMGMEGDYGFFEAVDFTKGRNNGSYSIVRSFMAHHIGMSFLSVANLLHNECMQRRFMSDSFMSGAKSLLEEKIETGASIFKAVRTEEIPQIRERVQAKKRCFTNISPFAPNATMFFNGRMTSCLTDSGAGVTMLDGKDLTVNSEDILSHPQGVFAVFVQENKIIPFVSAIDNFSGAKFKAEFSKNKALHIAEYGNLILKMETSLLKQKNCEIRRFTVENTDDKNDVKGKLLVYFEPCLEKREDFSAHPAFSKLFLMDKWEEDAKCAVFYRRERQERSRCAVAAGFAEDTDITFEANREWVLTTPKGVFSIGEKSDFKSRRGNPDCCCAFSAEMEIKSNDKKALNFIISAEETKEQAKNTFMAVRNEKVKRQFSENPFYVDLLEYAVSDNVLPRIMYPKTNSSSRKVGEYCNFRLNDLWSFGISGDLPIILIEIESESRVKDAVPYIRVNKVLRSCGIASDLVLFYSENTGYFSPISDALKQVTEDEDCILMLGVKGGIHLVNSASHSYEEMSALKSNAVYIVNSAKKEEKPDNLLFKPLKTVVSNAAEEGLKESSSVKRYTFTECKICIEKSLPTVDIPWNMVFANQSFGTMVSDKALGFTWAINSRENKLTPWYNDTMSDNRGELLFAKYNGVLYDVASLGKAEFTPHKASWQLIIDGVEIKAEIRVAKKGMAKKCTVEIENNSGGIRNFDLLYYTLPVLGVSREKTGVLFAKKVKSGAIIQNSNASVSGFSVLQCDDSADYICFSRKSVFEGNFNSENDEINGDCCAAVGRNVNLAAGGKIVVNFYLSWGATESAAIKMPFVSDFGEMMLNPVKIKTADENLNLFFNSFLYSQIKQSRFYGRTGFYQCSGAYGFRDQLQDSLAFIDFEPQITLRHIFRSAAVQFTDGDVLHWWHVLLDKRQKIQGIRTKCSDDMLWLPYACIIFRERTQNNDFLSVEIPYIEGECLRSGEKERYFIPQRSKTKETLLQHCIRAVDRSLNFGENGFPLIGSCDWNDGFSNIGSDKSGESVWLAMFLKIVLDGMTEICQEFGLREKSSEYSDISDKLAKAIDEKAWQNYRYCRAFLQNGEALGGEDGFIDILPQAFSVFSGIGKDGKSDIALTTALEELFSEKSGVIRLLSPSFDEKDIETIGYIASYPAGIRENSGQYTHAAVWLAKALLQQGRADDAEKLISVINPLHFYRSEESARQYRAEPYVLAGDISFGDDIVGRAGWTHFTGSASWYFRCVYEYLTSVAKAGKKEDKNDM